MGRERTQRKYTRREEPYSTRSNWTLLPGTVNSYYWSGRRTPDLNSLPKGGTKVEPPEFKIDRNAGMIIKPRGGGSGVEDSGDRQTVLFYPPLSPTSNQRMTDRFANNDKLQYSPIASHGVGQDGTLSVTTNSGATYKPGGVYGNMHIFHRNLPDPKTPEQFGFDEHGSNMSLPIGIFGFARPFPPLPPSGEILLTRKRVRDWGGGVRKGFSGDTQQGAMANLSAKEVAVRSGLVASGDYHWVHLFAFTMGGIDNVNPNVPDNLVVGTKASNMIHEKIEAKVKNIVENKGNVTVKYEVNVSDPLHKPFNLDWHVATEITWTIVFANNVEFVHTLDLLSHNPPRRGEKQFLNELMDYQVDKAAAGT